MSDLKTLLIAITDYLLAGVECTAPDGDNALPANEFVAKSFLGDILYSTNRSRRWHQQQIATVASEIQDLIDQSQSWGEAQDSSVERKANYGMRLEERLAGISFVHVEAHAAYKALTGENWKLNANSRNVTQKHRQTSAVRDATAWMSRIQRDPDEPLLGSSAANRDTSGADRKAIHTQRRLRSA